MRTDPRRVLILDNDLGVMFWLGWSLAAEGHQAYPAKNVSGARKLLARIKPEIDLLIVNPSLRGAAEFANGLREHRRRLKVVVLAESSDPRLTKFSKVDAAIARPATDADVRIGQLLHTVERLLLRHQTA